MIWAKPVTLVSVIGDRPVVREDWHALARVWGVLADYRLQAIAPAGVACKTCWDYGRCAECLGEYADQCPAECGDGRCPACGKLGEAGDPGQAVAP